MSLRAGPGIDRRENQTRAALFEYAKKLKEREKKKKVGMPEPERPVAPQFTEQPLIRQVLPLPEEDDGFSEVRALIEAADAERIAKENPNEFTGDIPSLIASNALINEARACESYVDEEALSMRKDYDTDDLFEAAQLMVLNKSFRDSLDEVAMDENEQGLEEENETSVAASKAVSDRHNRVTKIADEEFRDNDKAIFAIIREYPKEPLRIWK